MLSFRSAAPSFVLSLFALTACGSADVPPVTVSPPAAPLASGVVAPPPVAHEAAIAAVHRAKCGQCHLRVEPGQRPRDVLEAALLRHRRRVLLTDPQWTAMVDYLAPASAAR